MSVRPIDADALFAEIKERHDMFVDCEYIGDKARRDELSSFMADIVNAPTIGGWISVKDRLPEPEEKVIIWAKTGCMRYAQYHNDGSKNPWYVYEDDARAWTNVISHWMPLPEPPKEVSVDG